MSAKLELMPIILDFSTFRVRKRSGLVYALIDEELTWRAALGNCLLLGGNLAVVNNSEEYEFLKQMLLEQRAGSSGLI